jgi:MFS transporter, DHA1 family, tetracycline resistance protein
MRKASLFTIFLIVFIDLVGFGILLPNQQYYGELLGIHNAFYLTLIGPAYSFFQFIFAPILGRWSDRIGRRPVLLLSQGGTLLSYFFLFSCTFVTHWNPAAAIFLLYFSRIFAGIAGGNISIATAYIADITTPENRAKGMGLVGAAFGIGFVCGPAIGGIVGWYLGLEFVPITAAVFSATALILTFLTLPESHHPGEITEGLRRFSVTGLERALARPVIGTMIWMVFINGFAFAGMEQTFSLLIQERAFQSYEDPVLAARHASGASGALFGSIGIILAAIQGGFIGRLTKAFGEPPLAAVGPFITALGLFLVGAAGVLIPGVWPLFIVGSALLAIGSSLFNPSLQSLISRHAGCAEQGEILGAMQGMASLARAVGPLLAGLLYAHISSGAPYYASAAICVVVAVWAAFMHKRLAPPRAEVQPLGGFPIEADAE